MELTCEGRRAVVTAAGSGIGRTLAETLMKNGAQVFACDIAEPLIEELTSAGIGALVADVARPGDVDKLFDAAQAAMGGVDVLINNAGIAGPTARVEDVEPADWDRTIAVNVSGQFYCARRAVPLMKEAGRGTIVNISSTAGRLGFPLRLPYATSKYALTGFTDTLAMELGPHHINVNAIMPGYVLNERGARVLRAKAEASGRTVEEIEAIVLRNISMRTGVTQDEIAAMVVYLCSEAGRHVSGQTISIDGNLETYTGMDKLDP